MKASLTAPQTRVLVTAATLVACGAPPEPIDVVEATIAEVQEALTSGRTTCRMVVQAYLDRIETYDRSTGLNAKEYETDHCIVFEVKNECIQAVREYIDSLYLKEQMIDA